MLFKTQDINKENETYITNATTYKLKLLPSLNTIITFTVFTLVPSRNREKKIPLDTTSLRRKVSFVRQDTGTTPRTLCWSILVGLPYYLYVNTENLSKKAVI